MSKQQERSRAIAKTVCWILLCGLVGTAAAAKPGNRGASAYADVRITYAGQTFEFAGVQQSFSVSQDGGRIVFDLTQVGTPGSAALPDMDLDGLPATGNLWKVVTKLGGHSYSFTGTCASQTFNAVDADGGSVRELYLNCSDLQSD